jgi:phenylalanyl-tRNA synthetase alpha chain
MQVYGSMGKFAKEERPIIGKAVNQAKTGLEAALAEKEESIKAASQQEALIKETLDVTLPGRKPRRGRIHPLHQTLRQIYKIFGEMGFQIYRSPEVETEDYNFTFLNMPPYHPARDMWDTFYTDKEGVVLRTHTSPGQVRVMRERAPENIRVILPGTTMRYEQLTARSEIEFIQVELLVVGKGITFANMRGTLNDFARRTFGENARTRLRPSSSPLQNPALKWMWNALSAAGKAAASARAPAGWRSLAVVWCIRPCSSTVDMTQKSIPVLLPAWASTAQL